MRVPVEWLKEYVATGLPVEELATRLAMTGTEVDRVEHHGVGGLDHFVVGRVLQAQRHPDADRLTVCVVDVGDGVEAQIVCGAPNVAAGQLVAVGRPGAVMPDGTELGRATLRGVASEGMILAEDELAIGPAHDETLVLADDDGLLPGQPLQGVLPIATDVLELEITPNRPDCLGVYGVAREAHAATGAALAPPPWDDDPGRGEPSQVEGIEIVVEATDLCPRFTARAFENVQIGASPPWLKARLMAAGQRPINNVVDITNYVMLLTGQPLHAFDMDRIGGGRLVVRRAGAGEKVVTLDGQARTLDADVCLIADDEGPTSIAGVMGGSRSEVQDDTTRVLMEVANWDGANIHQTALKLNLRSEASARFEKGLAPEQALEAQAVATRLMLDLTGATLRPGTIDVGGPGSEPQTIRLRDQRVSGLLGVHITRSESALHLKRLGFETAERPDGLDVTVPPFRRNDVTREADLIEEVARLHGVNDQLPATLPSRRGAVGVLAPPQRLRRRAEDALVGRGLLEIVGWSFESPERGDRLLLPDDDSRRRNVVIENPMSEEQSVMRTTLLGSMLDVARHNVARGQGVRGIFESGRVYIAGAEQLPHEHHALGALVPGDVFAAKGFLEAVLRALRVQDVQFASAPQPFLHPGRSASVSAGGEIAGWVGDVHPLVAREWDLDAVAAFEVDLDAICAHALTLPTYEDLTSFPELREDIAIVVDAGVPAATVLATVRDAGGELLARAEIFDVYRGEQIAQGRTSLAIALTFRAPDRTLTDADVAPVRKRIVARLAGELGGELRG
ncbi:MAG: phenylalanyl-tRNA synthetase beta chain [Solirubrobacteraceae bacterium]|jgi:phenylalanyl-tRNA synthetase beta chain|nr:phenylalanyl-tRNA synthetase beta chain [Solirubrobacteraceae bacterium]